MENEIRKYINIIEDINNQQKITQINEVSFYKIFDTHSKEGYIIISSFRNEKPSFQNKEDFKKLKNDIKNNGFSFIPVYGGFIENKGMENEKEVIEPALFVPNYKIASTSPYDDDEKLKNLGIEMARKYGQESFLFKPKGSNYDAYYINQNGEVEMKFTDKKINDVSSIYFTDLTKTKKPDTQKAHKRFTFGENIYVNSSPKDLNEARKRHGELFINL